MTSSAPSGGTAAGSVPRFERFELPGGVRLAINSNRKLKTVLVKAFVSSDLDGDTTCRALLAEVLQRGTRSHPDLQAIHRHLEGLFGAHASATVAKMGEWHIARFGLSVVNEIFLPGDARVLREGLDFLHELMFSPHVVEGAFEPTWVDQEKTKLRRQIESLIDDKSSWAMQRCVEEMCPEEPYRLYDQGRVEDLAAVGPSDLRAFHSRWMRRAPIAVYVAGEIDIARMRDEIARLVDVDREEVAPVAAVPTRRPVGAPREVVDRLDVNQGKLIMGFRHGITYADPRYEALLLMNGILGGYGHSKLFQNVREKASLAYSAYSSIDRHKGLLFISCGIAVENYARAVAISLEQVEAMRRGEFDTDELFATRETILNQNRMLEDDFSSLMEVDFARSLHGRDLDLEGFRRRLCEVTRDDIVAAARELQLDLTYFLRDDAPGPRTQP